MNAWLLAALVLMAGGLAPCLAVACRGRPVARLTGVTLGATVLSTVFLLLAQGYSRTSYTDLALVLSVLSPLGTLVFTRLLAPGGEQPESATETESEPRPGRDEE